MHARGRIYVHPFPSALISLRRGIAESEFARVASAAVRDFTGSDKLQQQQKTELELVLAGVRKSAFAEIRRHCVVGEGGLLMYRAMGDCCGWLLVRELRWPFVNRCRGCTG